MVQKRGLRGSRPFSYSVMREEEKAEMLERKVEKIDDEIGNMTESLAVDLKMERQRMMRQIAELRA